MQDEQLLKVVLQDSSEALELKYCTSACNFYFISDLNIKFKPLFPNWRQIKLFTSCTIYPYVHGLVDITLCRKINHSELVWDLLIKCLP